MKYLFALVLATFALSGPVPAISDEASGQVDTIIIKIMTPDGPRWFKLGAELLEIDVTAGSTVIFNYVDDTTEDIEVIEVLPKPDN